MLGPTTFARELPESSEELNGDSRWPAFFPCSISIVTTTDGEHTAVEKVVGASIVNRFPYIIALSFCIEELSSRHYARSRFIEMLEKGGSVAIHYFEPGPQLDRAMGAISQVPDERTHERIAASGLPTRRAITNEAPVFSDAYLVYEALLAKTGSDFSGQPIYEQTYVDCGSHRIYFLEIEAIQLRKDIAHGQSAIHWRALPYWNPKRKLQNDPPRDTAPLIELGYKKGYEPDYVFPSSNTVAFQYDEIANGMAVKRLPALAEDQVEVDNDRARWPCFFPSSAGLITTWADDGVPNLMPCGSTTVLARDPLCIGICVSYAEINERYAPRASLRALNERKRFACGVPFGDEKIIEAIKYAGNISVDKDRNKIRNAGLEIEELDWAPVLPGLPITFLCEVKDVVRLGTHFLYLGEVKSIRIRDDVTPENPLTWFPYPDVRQSA